MINFNHLSNDYRINYYIGNYSLRNSICYLKQNIDNLELCNIEKRRENKYENDIIKIIDKFKLNFKTIKYCPRDRVELFFDAPTLVKSRLISNIPNYSILYKMNTRRHFNDIETVKKKDIPFLKKKNKLIWRGATTGYGFGNFIPERSTSREVLVKKYCNEESISKNMDIGLSKLCQNGKKEEYKKYIRPTKTIQELLEYKYILSVEGNDIATNLKWILYSNSVLFMPNPSIESWIMETHLIPYIHYIPVEDDFSDLEEKMKWCDHNEEECLDIIKNSREYIEIFLDEQNEDLIMKKVIEQYIKNVNFI